MLVFCDPVQRGWYAVIQRAIETAAFDLGALGLLIALALMLYACARRRPLPRESIEPPCIAAALALTLSAVFVIPMWMSFALQLVIFVAPACLLVAFLWRTDIER